MKLNPKAEVVPGKKQIYTDLVIAAHQDDIEIMCPQGIVKGYQSDKYGLVAVVTADGGGSPRAGDFATMTDEEMKKVRRLEQMEAARIGDYSELIMLNYTSAEIKDRADDRVTEDYWEILLHYRPETLYVHNLADKHPTHVGTVIKAIRAVRSLPKEARPAKMYGCEVWRALDWLSDDEKVVFDLTGYEKLLADVLDVFVSQIAGGKQYSLASAGRRTANATYAASHGVDQYAQCAYAMDLTPLIEDDSIDPRAFILGKLKKFEAEILA